MSSDRDTLLSMGFEPARVEWAWKATGGAGLQPAMDHIIVNEGNPVPDLSTVSSASASRPPAGDEDDEDAEALRAIVANGGDPSAQEARSIKCSMCGKIFKNTALANFHAEKSGHDQFEESTEEVKPLTEEEKKQKLQELREKLAAKRAVKSVEDAQDQKANELLRRKAGKDAAVIRDELKRKEVEKEAAKKKQEKIDDAKAKAAIKAQIEADKKARAEKAAREKAAREGKLVEEAGPATVATPAAAAPATAGRDYKETRLQIRLATGGSPFTTSLPSESTLQDVANWLVSQNAPVAIDSLTFSTQFPRKVFNKAEWSQSLRDLGLTPSAVLMAS